MLAQVPVAEPDDAGTRYLLGRAWLAAEPADRPPGPSAAGAVSVLRGTSTGDPVPVTVWTQNSPGIKGAAEEGDSFGWSIGGGAGRIA